MRLDKRLILGLSTAVFLFTAACSVTFEKPDEFEDAPVETADETEESGPLNGGRPESAEEPRYVEGYLYKSPGFDDYLRPPSVRFVPLPASFSARGIYVTANVAGISERLDGLAMMCSDSGLNAFVIDVRTEDEITIKNWIAFADEWEISKNFIPDVGVLMDTLKRYGIYPIARVCTFLDGYTVNHRPELYIHNEDGTVWEGPVHNGSKRYPWLNPYNRDAWDYVLTYAKAAAEIGFKEIQFDYVRFAATDRLLGADFGETGGLTRTEIILEFLRYAVSELRPLGVVVSADVYGTIINSDVDAEIVGQDYAELARVVDVICPMIYPSHFAGGTFGIKDPDTKPYEVVREILLKSNERLSELNENERRAEVRPWLQDFTATWLSPHLEYKAEERDAQMRAAYEVGVTEWLLWDPRNNYAIEGITLP